MSRKDDQADASDVDQSLSRQDASGVYSPGFGPSISFDDVEGSLANAKGVLDGDGTMLGDGLAFYFRKEVNLESDGMSIVFSHSACGQNYRLTVSWIEALALASELKPRLVYSSKLHPGGMSFVAQFPSARATLGDWEKGPRSRTWSLLGMRCNYSFEPCRRRDMKIIVPSEQIVAAVDVAKRHNWVEQAAIDWCDAYLAKRSRDYLIEFDEDFLNDKGNWIP